MENVSQSTEPKDGQIQTLSEFISTQTIVGMVVCVAVILMVIIIIVKCYYLKNVTNKNFQNARRIRTISETLRDRPPDYTEFPMTVYTLNNNTIEISIPDSPPYVKDPPPYHPWQPQGK